MADWPSDKELEDIYRKGSERHDFQYSEEAWDDMEILLDDKKRKRRFFFLLFAIGLLAIGYISLPLFSDVSTNKTSIVQDNNKNTTSTKNTSDQNIAKVISGPTNSSDLNSSTAKNNIEIEISKDNSQSDPNSVVTKSESIVNSKNSSSLGTKQSTLNFSSNSKDSNSDENQRLSEAIISKDFNSNQKQSLNLIDHSIKTSTTNSPSSRASLSLAPLDIMAIKKLALGEIAKLEIPLFSDPILSEKSSQKSKFSYTSQFGIESSWTPQGEYSRINYNVGLKMGYAISKRFTFNIGAYYLQDSYIAEKGDYKPESNFWKSQETPEYTDANCKMLELTTGISYAFSQNEKSQFSLSVDLLSNFMLKEKYSYHFANEADDFQSSWTTANRTFLNGLSISTNYRLNLTDKWHIEAGPYLKVPLEGIGHGQIMLSSIGIRVGIGL